MALNTASVQPRIASIATAVPPYLLKQDDISQMAARVFGDSVGDFSRYMPVYQNAAIENRYSCVPIEWFEKPVGFAERNRLYTENALTLLAEVGEKAVQQAGLNFDDIDGLVVVSSSGIATPSLDALLMEKLQLRRNMERLPIFGLGCCGGIIGLARTAQLAQGARKKHYLYMVVELCGLDFMHSDRSKSNVIATALFGDGASAAVISCDVEGPGIEGWGEHTWPDSLDVMGWDVTDDGLKAVFSQSIPDIVHNNMRELVDNFLSLHDMNLKTICDFLCHPGGAKVLDAIEVALELPHKSLLYSRDIMRRYGNMSAATVMFVLDAALRDPKPGHYLLSAFGPGFTAGLMLLHV